MADLFIEVAGEQIPLRPRPAAIVFYQYARAATDDRTGESMEGLAAIDRFFEGTMSPAGYRRFSRLALDENLSGDDLIPLVGQIMEAFSGRPTEQPSSSAPSQLPAGQNSTADASSPESSDPEPEIPPGTPVRHVRLWQPTAEAV